MASVKDIAICVRHWDWSETSQTVSILCREHGLVRAVVKGARREVRRELAQTSQAVLQLHRTDAPHAATACPLCTALA